MVLLLSAVDQLKHYLFVRLDVFQFDTYFVFSGKETQLRKVMQDWTNWLEGQQPPPAERAEGAEGGEGGVDTSPCEVSKSLKSLIVNGDWTRIEFQDLAALTATVREIPSLPHNYRRFRVIHDFYLYAEYLHLVAQQASRVVD